jgi:hypothetical protein
MIWANSVLPVFMAVSGPKPEILREPHFQIQIGDTQRRSETLVTHGLQRFTFQFNRTAVMRPLFLVNTALWWIGDAEYSRTTICWSLQQREGPPFLSKQGSSSIQPRRHGWLIRSWWHRNRQQ